MPGYMVKTWQKKKKKNSGIHPIQLLISRDAPIGIIKACINKLQPQGQM